MLSVNKISNPAFSAMDDHELVRAFRNDGDQQAFAELLNRHQNKVYSYIYSMVMNPDVANDIFQETFTKVITKMDDTYNEQGKWIAWVMRIAHNATIDHIRKRKRFVDVNASADSDYDFYDRLEDKDSPDAQDDMEFGEAKHSLLKHISSLPKEQREVVMLRHYHEMSFKEIAELTNVSINTALGRMRYALINLRKMFDKENGKTYEYVQRG
ncbi:MAG: sigma-70 family RNA polymerase sigma factor [Candidatus Cyclonatronum sp.]|uniref:RNA polymerase sigma factor n=1 Tax=Cyclonatronum sp. TaxID=3024185 RepID=UPI0025C6594F|nr:sigma-70 family RNA polymerase sigma factor [Cyclonatronum sp.]MCC5935216.1 sigma-70 family RNA polymerase sigma factor [Balneolales bacterium]MCH8487067.1 sigma-70 family RNA polymerase sigma factor [Cyclonatronum sp.]